MDVQRTEPGDSDYPTVLLDRLGDTAPQCLYAMGDATIIRNRLLGLVCSIQCPGSIVIKTYDAIRELRDASAVVVGGFHLPMERECLDILLRGDQPAVLCAAKGLPGLRFGREARQAMREGRLLVLFLFDDKVRRTTAAQAMQRNDVVAAMAETVLVPYAAPGGKTWATVHDALGRRQAVFTFVDEANSALVCMGARAISVTHMTDLTSAMRASGSPQLESR